MPQPQVREYWRSLHTVEKVESEVDRLIRGLVTVGSVDSDGEIVDQRTAFEKLQRWLAEGGTPVTWMHDIGGSLGHCVEVEAMMRTEKGFMPSSGDIIDAVSVTTSIAQDYSFGTLFFGEVNVNNVWQMLFQKAINKLSIGFRGFEGGEDEVTGAPIVMVQRVFEYAVVTVPAQREAEVVVERMLKSLGMAHDCTECRTKLDKGFKRARRMTREQWAYAVRHAQEHTEERRPQDLRVLAKAFAGVGDALNK